MAEGLQRSPPPQRNRQQTADIAGKRLTGNINDLSHNPRKISSRVVQSTVAGHLVERHNFPRLRLLRSHRTMFLGELNKVFAQSQQSIVRKPKYQSMKFLIFPALQTFTILLIFLDIRFLWISPLLFSFLALACVWIPDRSKLEEFADLEQWGSSILYVSAGLQIVLVTGLFLMVGKEETSLNLVLSAAAALGVYNGAAGGNLSHEFMHRLTRLDLTISRMLSAMALHSTFAIDHLNTHHKEASRIHDPASAVRGQNFWDFAIKSFFASNQNAAVAESRRLSRIKLEVFRLQNRFTNGHLLELIYLTAAFLLAGIPGLVAAIAGGVLSILLIEGFNYIAHYGLIRTDTGPYEARHAWSTRRVLSSSFTFNITQHSQHHLHPSWHFWEIETQPDMPVLPMGPSLLATIAAIPPLWFRYMRPHLKRWDEEYASEEELRIRDLTGFPS